MLKNAVKPKIVFITDSMIHMGTHNCGVTHVSSGIIFPVVMPGRKSNRRKRQRGQLLGVQGLGLQALQVLLTMRTRQ